jgi:hypothetical protein
LVYLVNSFPKTNYPHQSHQNDSPSLLPSPQLHRPGQTVQPIKSLSQNPKTEKREDERCHRNGDRRLGEQEVYLGYSNLPTLNLSFQRLLIRKKKKRMKREVY